jgi:hypothetical protein
LFSPVTGPCVWMDVGFMRFFDLREKASYMRVFLVCFSITFLCCYVLSRVHVLEYLCAGFHFNHLLEQLEARFVIQQ